MTVLNPIPRGVELGYAEITSDPPATATGGVDIAGLSITVTVGSRPIIVEAYSALVTNTTVNTGAVLRILEGATLLNYAENLVAANLGCVLNARVRLAPSAGSHTYKVQLGAVLGGSALMRAGTDHPAFIQAVEI